MGSRTFSSKIRVKICLLIYSNISLDQWFMSTHLLNKRPMCRIRVVSSILKHPNIISLYKSLYLFRVDKNFKNKLYFQVSAANMQESSKGLEKVVAIDEGPLPSPVPSPTPEVRCTLFCKINFLRKATRLEK